MAWGEITGNTTTLTGSNTEDSIIASQTAAGQYALAVDLNAMVNGDVIEIRAYSKVRSGATSRVLGRWSFANAQAEANWQSPIMVVGTGEILVKMVQSAGTGRAIITSLIGDPGGLDAAGTRTAVGLASANLDTQLSAIKTDVDAIPTTKTGYALTSAYDPAKTASQAGDAMTLSATGQGNVRTAIGLATANLDTQLAAIPTVTALTASGVRTAVGLASANLDTQLSAIKTDVDAIPTTKTGYALTSAYDPAKTAAQVSDIPTAAAISDEVWDEPAADHVASGTMGQAMGAAGGSGDPWITAVPGSYSAGQAGYVLGNMSPGGLDAAGVRGALGMASANLDTQLAAIKTDVDAIPTTKTGYALTSAYDPAKTATQAGDLMGLANGAITAAKFATDAIDANALKADAVTEIQSGLSTLTQANVRTAVGLGSANLDTQLGAIKTDVDAIPTTKTGYALTSAYDAAKTAAQPGDVPSAIDNASAIFQRDMADEEDTAPLVSLTGAVLKASAQVVDDGTNLITHKSSGGQFMSQAITRAARVNPIVEVGGP